MVGPAKLEREKHKPGIQEQGGDLDAFRVCASASRAAAVEHVLSVPFCCFYYSATSLPPCYATEIGIACFPSASQKQRAEQLNFFGSPVVSCSYCVFVAKQEMKQKGTYKGSSRTPFKPTEDRDRKKPGDIAYV